MSKGQVKVLSTFKVPVLRCHPALKMTTLPKRINKLELAKKISANWWEWQRQEEKVALTEGRCCSTGFYLK